MARSMSLYLPGSRQFQPCSRYCVATVISPHWPPRISCIRRAKVASGPSGLASYCRAWVCVNIGALLGVVATTAAAVTPGICPRRLARPCPPVAPACHVSGRSTGRHPTAELAGDALRGGERNGGRRPEGGLPAGSRRERASGGGQGGPLSPLPGLHGQRPGLPLLRDRESVL